MRTWWLLMLTACGTGDKVEETAVPGSSGFDPSWAGAQQLFDTHCVSCHPATTGIDLHAAVADDVATGAGRYVVAGDSAASPLWEAIAGTSLSNMMPPSGRLDASVTAPIGQWIDAGASLE